MKVRPVITGIGLVSPIGIGKETFWEGILSGVSGAGRISQFDPTGFSCQIACEVKDPGNTIHLNPGEKKYFPRGTQFACAAFREAIVDAGLLNPDPYRTDVIIGAGHISLESLENEIESGGENILQPWFGMKPAGLLKTMIHTPATAISLIAGIRGYITTISSACSSGLDAIGIAASRIMNREAECVICGGVDTPINRITVNAFTSAKMLNTENGSDPDVALTPFDKRHTKSILGEGAGVLILEDSRTALARGAKIYAEVGGYSQGAENVNEVFFTDKSGKRWAEVIRSLFPKKNKFVSLINAHGPSDEQMDRLEANVIRSVFEKESKRIPVFSIKTSIGSSMGAAGALQTVAGALSIHQGVIPLSGNFLYPDPECSINVMNKSKKEKITSVLINSHGLGGINTALLLKEFKL